MAISPWIGLCISRRRIRGIISTWYYSSGQDFNIKFVFHNLEAHFWYSPHLSLHKRVPSYPIITIPKAYISKDVQVWWFLFSFFNISLFLFIRDIAHSLQITVTSSRPVMLIKLLLKGFQTRNCAWLERRKKNTSEGADLWEFIQHQSHGSCTRM